MRRPIVAGNWKCHLTLAEATALVEQLTRSCPSARPGDRERRAGDAVEVVVCPPFTALSTVAQALKGSALGLGAQDVFWEPSGAFTGEVSVPMLADVGCAYVILGHSERRTHFGETDETVQRKLQAVLTSTLSPIVCVGETLAEREGGQTHDVLTRQLTGAFRDCPPAAAPRIVVAYEPVWAIGTGRNAAPAQAQEAQQFIRGWLAQRFGAQTAEAVRIQYGGSVTAANAVGLLSQPDVDGALVGGASLQAEAFSAIVKAAHEAKKGSTQHTAHSTQSGAQR